ncbi:MAG TPA: hypothetical protein VKY22_09475 [Bradyrhizobium sp.]|nr:hypothetical protein [Bradyrhizobium sp.]
MPRPDASWFRPMIGTRAFARSYFCTVVSDLEALIDHVQASIKLIETVQAQQAAADAEPADVVVLDDVTPLYMQASAALDACNARLSAALDYLIESASKTPD